MDGEIWAIAAPGAVGTVDVRVFVRGATNFNRTVTPNEPARLLPAGIPTNELIIQNLGSVTIEIGNDRSLVYGQGLRIAPNSILSAGAITPGGPGAAVIENFARAGLPAAGNAGRLARLTDYDRGLWMDDGVLWRSITGRVFDVTAFGAIADNGTTDNGPAFNAAITALAAAGGGVLVIPESDGYYGFTTPIVLDDVRVGMRLRGSDGSATSTVDLRWLGGAGSGPLLRGDSMASVAFEGLRFSYSNAAYNGDLVKAGHSGSGVDIWKVMFDHCEFVGTGAAGARTLLSLSATIVSVIRGCAFNGCQVAIRLGDFAYGAGTVYTDGVVIDGACTFNNCSVRAIRLGGSNFATTISGNTFEPLVSGAMSGVDTDAAAAGQILAFTYIGNWHGDANAAGGLHWLQLASPALRGAVIAGNQFDTVQVGEDAITLGLFTGIAITGNAFIGAAGAFSVNTTVNGSVGLQLSGNLGTIAPRNLANCPGQKFYAGNTDSMGLAGQLSAGVGVPNNAYGNNGDFYFRSDGGAGTSLYMKRAGAWVAIL